MFHTYVKASSGRQIDIDRARYLMDDALFDAAHRDLIKKISPNGFNPFDEATATRCGYDRQWRATRVWHHYCRLHKAKYGEPFEPDVNPEWDI